MESRNLPIRKRVCERVFVCAWHMTLTRPSSYKCKTVSVKLALLSTGSLLKKSFIGEEMDGQYTILMPARKM